MLNLLQKILPSGYIKLAPKINLLLSFQALFAIFLEINIKFVTFLPASLSALELNSRVSKSALSPDSKVSKPLESFILISFLTSEIKNTVSIFPASSFVKVSKPDVTISAALNFKSTGRIFIS